MYAIIEDSGQQFRVSEGDTLDVDLRDLEEGTEEIRFDKVLLVSNEGDVKVGTPLVDGANVTAKVLDPEKKGQKVYIHQWRRRKASKRKVGHRQKYLRVQVTSISA